MFKKSVVLLLISGLAFSFTNVQAQDETDALRYSELFPGATARSIGLGGAGGSLGGDFSSLSINPAGIGIYRHSKVMITPSLNLDNANSTYLNRNTKDHGSHVSLNNLGIVFTHAEKGKAYEQNKWKTFSVAIGYNRLADFNSNITYRGSNNTTSLTTLMGLDAFYNGVGQNNAPPLAFLAYQGYLLYDASSNYGSVPGQTILSHGGSLLQTISRETSGGIDNWTLSFGGNYNEKLMLGLGLNIQSYKYDRSSHFKEEDETGNTNNDFASFDYHEKLSTSGTGFNMKLGLIYIVNNHFRIGAAVHTPTWSAFTDISNYDLTSNTENFKASLGQSNTDPVTFVKPNQGYAFNYHINSPWSAVLSATAFLGNHGFITADYNYVDYASMRYRFSSDYSSYEDQVNQAIKSTFKGSHNIRIGIEGKEKNFMGRLGFAYHTSPYQDKADFQGQSMDISAGIGVRLSAFSIDLAYMHRIRKSGEYAYPLAKYYKAVIPVPMADIKQDNNIVALTLGYQF